MLIDYESFDGWMQKSLNYEKVTFSNQRKERMRSVRSPHMRRSGLSTHSGILRIKNGPTYTLSSGQEIKFLEKVAGYCFSALSTGKQ